MNFDNCSFTEERPLLHAPLFILIKLQSQSEIGEKMLYLIHWVASIQSMYLKKFVQS